MCINKTFPRDIKEEVNKKRVIVLLGKVFNQEDVNFSKNNKFKTMSIEYQFFFFKYNFPR